MTFRLIPGPNHRDLLVIIQRYCIKHLSYVKMLGHILQKKLCIRYGPTYNPTICLLAIEVRFKLNIKYLWVNAVLGQIYARDIIIFVEIMIVLFSVLVSQIELVMQTLSDSCLWFFLSINNC